MKISCIIVEDEPLAQDVLKKYISDISDLELIAICNNALIAYSEIQNNHVDLVFLDINMPRMTGIQFIKSLHEPPMVIFTTAYPEYAVEGFEVDAIDYLVKPFSFERFLKAVNKAAEKFKLNHHNLSNEEYVWIRADKKMHKVELNSILYLQAIGDYVKVVSENGHLLVHDTLSRIKDSLPLTMFIQIHRSYIVSLSKIKYIEANMISIGNEILPIGQAYKTEFLNYLKNSGN